MESQSSWKPVLLGQQKYVRTDEQKHGQKRNEIKRGKQEEYLILTNKEQT